MKDSQQGSDSAVLLEAEENDNPARPQDAPPDRSRRRFVGNIGGATAAVAIAVGSPLEPGLEGERGEAEASVVRYNHMGRAGASFTYRTETAASEVIDVGELPDNGDSERFPDYSGNWSKCLQHQYLGIPVAASYQSFLHALRTGRFQDFENILTGSPGGSASTSTFNGPQGALAFDLEGRDSHATVIPAAPSIASAQTAAELVEHYWAALMRDVNFTDYASSSLAAQACADMNHMSYVASSRNNQYPYPVTAQNLFRGAFSPTDQSCILGPYLSQFMLQPTFLGVQPISQMFRRFNSAGQGGSNFMTSAIEYLNVQNGGAPNGQLSFDPTNRYLRMGRDMAAYTHVDVLSQEYLIATLILQGIRTPVNPGNPYGYPLGVSRTEHGFVTFNSVFCNTDTVGTMMEMATRSLKAAWFHKWIVNLRNRPEEAGALVHARLTGQHPMPQAAAALNHDVLNSAAMAQIYSQYGSYLLPQAFPEGSPTHPCYPTGHGTVAGACITALKFFYDGSQPLQPLLQAADSDIMQPSEDGLSLAPYTGNDAGALTLNSELAKLGWNVTIAHGIHAGIHFRSSSLYSLLLGEEVALTVLQDRAYSYNEPFTIQITKFDGTTATISNQGGGYRDRGRPR
jgi:hypothetical protein